ncbi:hypothetical protein ABFS83_03G024500 [Erythranthe nasuta]
MICRNITSSIPKHCFLGFGDSHVSSTFSLHFFSTLNGKQTTVFDILLHKHHFSPEVASLASSHLIRLKNPEKADSVLSYFKEIGFSKPQLEKIVRYMPRILSANVEKIIKPKVKVFRDLGFSSDICAKIITGHLPIIHSSLKNSIVPALNLLKELLGSNDEVARLLKTCAWFLTTDLEKNMMPNVEFLKTCGVPMEHILILFRYSPRCMLNKPEIMRKSVRKTEEIGFNRSSKMFVYALRIISCISDEVWELKLRGFRDLGFSDTEILSMFRKAPTLFTKSMETTKAIKQILLETGKFDMSAIVNNPMCLTCSIENRFKPRLEILGILESKGLIKHWPSLSTFCILTDDNFCKKYIGPNLNQLFAESTSQTVVGKKKN